MGAPASGAAGGSPCPSWAPCPPAGAAGSGARGSEKALATVPTVLLVRPRRASVEAEGWTVMPWNLRDQKIAYCLGCFECWTKTPGLCRINDTGRDVARAVIGSDLTIYLTPITFGGYSSELKKAVDRIICLISPFFTRIEGEVHHHARYDRYPDLLGVGVLSAPHPAQEQIFRTLIGRNAINLHAPAHRSTVVYRTQDPAAIMAILHDLPRKAERLPA